MTSKRAMAMGVLALMLAGGAWAVTSRASAQSPVVGTVEHVDPSTRTIYFSDGSILQLKPGAVLYVDGRPVAIDDLAPGARAEMKADALASPATHTVAAVPPAHPPINVEGTVAGVDSQAGLITFTDGRVVRATGGTFVWLSVPLASLQPGMNVVVHQAQPAVTSSSVSSPDTSATVVTTPARGERQVMTTRGSRSAARDTYGSALPRFRFDAKVPPDQIHVLFPPQAP